jgi:hypothetical protein
LRKTRPSWPAAPLNAIFFTLFVLVGKGGKGFEAEFELEMGYAARRVNRVDSGQRAGWCASRIKGAPWRCVRTTIRSRMEFD